MYLFFDTETTGKFNWKLPVSDPQQPRIVQLGLQVLDKNLVEMARWTTLIQPAGWTIPGEAEGIHGISLEMCEKYGVPIQHAMAILSKYRKLCQFHICHNEQFDRNMVDSEVSRLGHESFLGQNGYCTMRASTAICQIPGPRGNKWPTLAEAFKFFTGMDMQVWMEDKGLAAHDAQGDVCAMVEVFKVMRKDYQHSVYEGMRV